MKTVNIKRTELLKTIIARRDEHSIEYKELFENYRLAVIERLTKLIDSANKGQVSTNVNLQAPVDHTADYNTVITMLEMSVDDVITLDQHEFNTYVLDNWDWKYAHNATKALYSNSF